MKLSDSDVLYLDSHVVAVYKPKGLVTQPTSEHSDSLETSVKEYLAEKFDKPRVFLHAIFRLDKPVSGIVLFAKTSKALSRLGRFQREGRLQKFYRATVEGSPPPQGRLIHYLKKIPFAAAVFDEPFPGARRAELSFRRLGLNPSELEIQLVTGRYHQIRAQLGKMGHPIQGDVQYGAKKKGPLMLEHVLLRFPHPIGEKEMEIRL